MHVFKSVLSETSISNTDNTIVIVWTFLCAPFLKHTGICIILGGFLF